MEPNCGTVLGGFGNVQLLEQQAGVVQGLVKHRSILQPGEKFEPGLRHDRVLRKMSGEFEDKEGVFVVD